MSSSQQMATATPHFSKTSTQGTKIVVPKFSTSALSDMLPSDCSVNTGETCDKDDHVQLTEADFRSESTQLTALQKIVKQALENRDEMDKMLHDKIDSCHMISDEDAQKMFLGIGYGEDTHRHNENIGCFNSTITL